MAMDIVEFQQDSESPPRMWRATPVRRIELICVVLTVAVCDRTIYDGHGFAGYALLFAVLPVLLYFGVARWASDASCRIIVPMLLVLAIRLLWCGDWLMVTVGFALLALVAMSFAGQRPWLLEAIVFVAQIVPAGFLANCQYAKAVAQVRGPDRRRNWLAVAIPAAAFFIFSLLFLLANPDLLTWVSEGLSDMFQRLHDWMIDVIPAPLQALFWVGVAWIAAGLIRPFAGIDTALADDTEPTPPPETSTPAPLYEPFRNTLAVVVVLFGVYLTYEFTTVWSRVFPPGSYSAYAHEGAFWLTVALAAATFMLSGIFQGRMLGDARLPVLRRWSRVWAAENFLLALGFFIYLYAVLPVDRMVMAYNVRRIMAGDPAPSVQISVHPIDAEGLRTLIPLLHVDDRIIRDGVSAILAERLLHLEADRANGLHWTAYQVADERLYAALRKQPTELAPYADPQTRRAAREAFDSYAYQWY